MSGRTMILIVVAVLLAFADLNIWLFSVFSIEIDHRVEFQLARRMVMKDVRTQATFFCYEVPRTRTILSKPRAKPKNSTKTGTPP